MSFRDRIDEGTPLRMGELARLLGYSRETVRKLVDAKIIKTVTLPGSTERRIPSTEAVKVAKSLKLL